MAKKNLQAAAAGAPDPGKKEKAFTIWTTPENVRLWKTYQKLKKDTLPTHAAFVEAALYEYIQAHPVTDEEMESLKRETESALSLF